MADSHRRSRIPGRKEWLYARSVWVPTLIWNVLLGRVFRVRNWWDEVDEHVVLGALPFATDVAKLKSIGITGVVNTCEEYAGPKKSYEKADIEQLRVPTIDFAHPSPDSVKQGVEFIEKHANKGGKVYVHCKAGRGRSATVVMGWLMKRNGLSPEEAQRKLAQVRRHVNPHLAERPVIREFYQSVVKTEA